MRAIWIVQGEQATWGNRRDREARSSFRAIGHGIANLQVLALGQDMISAGVINTPEQLIEAGIGVPAAPVVAELRYPWPDGGHRRMDSDRSRRLDLWIGHEVISRERAVRLTGGGAGALGEAAREAISRLRRYLRQTLPRPTKGEGSYLHFLHFLFLRRTLRMRLRQHMVHHHIHELIRVRVGEAMPRFEPDQFLVGRLQHGVIPLG